MTATILGWILLGLPLLLLGIYFLWRRWRTIFWMYFGALILGLGYLTATGALYDIGSPLHALIHGSEEAAIEAGQDSSAAPAAPSDATVTTVPAGTEAPAGAESPAP